MSSTSAFDDHLAREVARSERLRMAVLAGLVGALVVVSGLLYALFQEVYREQFRTPAALLVLLAVLVGLVTYELVVRYVIGRRLHTGKGVPQPLRYLNAFVETSVPSLLILAVARETNPVHVLQGAVVLLYGVFIVLSTLRLDFRLSTFTGAVAAFEYVALCLLYAGSGGEAYARAPFETPPFYLAKGAMLLLSGLAAGFVGQQLKRRVDNAFRAQEERQRIVSTFGQQVSPEIVEELLRRGPGGESRRVRVCVLFMDVRNFTAMVEHKTPEQITAFQNAVFGEAIEIVNRHRGVINQFLGDGFMASFGAPIATGNDARNALAAARELVVRIQALSDAGSIPPTRIGVGVHAGEAVSGNIGSALRKQYSITGNVVILASRIEQLNKVYDSQILASEEVVRAGGDAAEGAAALGPVQLKGFAQPIEIYRLA